ncbi:MAG: mononuclear molybdenum enzyme YedY, partial [Woeseiaceae bacterium]
MFIAKAADIRPSEITRFDNYLDRRRFIQSGAVAAGSILATPALSALIPSDRRAKLSEIGESEYSTDETVNSYEDITSYNNYYEFGTQKDDPYRNSEDFEPHPWTIEVTGNAEKTGRYHLEDFVKPHAL